MDKLKAARLRELQRREEWRLKSKGIVPTKSQKVDRQLLETLGVVCLLSLTILLIK